MSCTFCGPGFIGTCPHIWTTPMPEDLKVPIEKTRPGHYGGEANPFEAIKIIEHYGLGFCLGNCIKYLLRAGKKGSESVLDDLKKARWYLDREIQALEKK